MLGTLASAAFVSGGALLIGQLALRSCGARRWLWLAAPVGLSVEMVVGVTAVHIPGRSVTTTVALVFLCLAGAAAMVREPALRPPVADVLAAAPVGLLMLVPFLAAGHTGILGVSINNDMAPHLEIAEVFRTGSLEGSVGNPAYPPGPHSLAAAMGVLWGLRVDVSFTGVSFAGPVVLAWTALGIVRSSRYLGRVVTCIAAGAPFLIAAYYGQGAFKEVLLPALVLGVVIALGPVRGELAPRARWVPLAALVAGQMAVYSFFGLVWSLGLLGIWLLVQGIAALPRRSPAGHLAAAREHLGPILVGSAALALMLVPMASQVRHLYDVWSNSTTLGNSAAGGSLIAQSSLGNLVGRLPLWEAFGVWNNPDFRKPAYPPNSTLEIVVMIALAGVGLVWSLRRRDWLLPAAAGVCLAVWFYCDRGESPYVAAKALVIATPVFMLLAVRPLVERDEQGVLPSWWPFAASVGAVAFAVVVVHSSWDALRFSRVGPASHANELRALRPLLGKRPTLFLGVDEFVRWELAGVPVSGPYITALTLPIRPEKRWEYGQPFDFDSLDAATLNQFGWIITPRDPAGSAPPENVRLVRRTRSFLVWRRTGTISPRSILVEGAGPASGLDCRRRRGRRLGRSEGVAAIRPAPIFAPAPAVAPGKEVTVSLPLGPGTWDLGSSYVSAMPLDVRAPGLRTTLPANLDRPGPRWPIGRIVVDRPGGVTLRIHEQRRFLTPSSATATSGSIVATPATPVRVVPLRRACGKVVDWYRVTAPPKDGRPTF